MWSTLYTKPPANHSRTVNVAKYLLHGVPEIWLKFKHRRVRVLAYVQITEAH
jgi:hypothetical protein